MMDGPAPTHETLTTVTRRLHEPTHETLISLRLDSTPLPWPAAQVAFVGGVAHGEISKSEFELLGDSAIVLIGRLPGLGNNGSDAATGAFPTYPSDTVVASNHFHGLGVWGKQSSALFQVSRYIPLHTVTASASGVSNRPPSSR